MGHILGGRVVVLALLGIGCLSSDAGAQLDPLLYLKSIKPNVLIAIDTANRMQRDIDGVYRDANVYRRLGILDAPWEVGLKVNDDNTTTYYRRKYVGLVNTDVGAGSDKFNTDHIEIVGDKEAGFSSFDNLTKMSIARRALVEAVTPNRDVAKFTLFRMRQTDPAFVAPGAEPHTWSVNESPVKVTNNTIEWADQKTGVGDNSPASWKITRPVVGTTNSSIGGPVGPLASDDNQKVIDILKLPTGNANSLIPAGRDGKDKQDAPLDNMLDDLKYEAERLIASDPQCANIVVVLVAGGGEGNISNENAVTKAGQFLNISGRRVPIYVVGINPLTSTDRSTLQGIANATGGQYLEVTADMVSKAEGNPIPEITRLVNVAVAQAASLPGDFNKVPDEANTFGFGTEHQVTSPIVGTVNLENATDINGAALPNTIITHPVTNAKIPQRSNVLVTAGFSLRSNISANGSGFDGKLRALRVYKPVIDTSKPTGYKFVSDGTKLWEASAPAAASRNIYTVIPDGTATGTVLTFTTANAAALRAHLRVGTDTAAANLIDFVRAQPLGAVVGSTPAIMDAPSLDPPPDSDYPGFADANKNRRSIIWVGMNDGMVHAIDARLGKEVWAFIPYNMLPKLRALPSGQPLGDFRFSMDGSPKVADVKVGGEWRSYLIIGQGPGGTFYQTFDVTLKNIATTAAPTTGTLTNVLDYFKTTTSVPLVWSFPSYSYFDPNLGEWGDLAVSTPSIYRTVGETWSDPAVGQIENNTGRFAVLTGSGFFKWSLQEQANRNGIVAGTTFYLLDAENGDVLDSRNVGSDNQGENIDNCAAINDCRKLKNALQADPVATGPPDSRFITKAYIGDLDGKIWRFDIGLDVAKKPVIKQLVSLYTINTGSGVAGSDHPVFASMASVNVGTTQQYLFVGTGSDLMPQNKVSTQYALLVILDQGTTGSKTGQILLDKTDGAAGGEKVSAFPAVAGDIVFFSTTTYPADACALPIANLYAFTFIGGPAYDTNNDGRVSTGGKSGPADSVKVQSTTGARATAPFIVDQHLVFGTGGNIEMFGDPEDFNNGVGQAGVRILSWREVR